MALAIFSGKTKAGSKGSSVVRRCKEPEPISGQTAQSIRESGMLVRCMARGVYSNSMAVRTQERSRRTRSTVMGSTFGATAGHIWVPG